MKDSTRETIKSIINIICTVLSAIAAAFCSSSCLGIL